MEVRARRGDGHPLRPVRRPPSSPRTASLASRPSSARPSSGRSSSLDLAPTETARAAAEAAASWVELRPTAWLITSASGDVLHASALVYALLDRTPAELHRVLADPGDTSPGFSWIRRSVLEHGRADVTLKVRLSDGRTRELDVASRRLPRSNGAEDRYYSVLTPREAPATAPARAA